MSKCCKEMITSESIIRESALKLALSKHKASPMYLKAMGLGITRLKFIVLHLQKKYKSTFSIKPDDWSKWFINADNM